MNRSIPRPEASLRRRILAAVVLAALSCRGAAVAAAASVTPAAAPDSVFATIGTQTIGQAVVDARAAASLQRVRLEEYEARLRALDAMIETEVLRREAEAKHTAPESLIAKEVDAKLPAATPAEIDTWWADARGQFPGKTKDQAQTQLVTAIQNDKRATARNDYVRGLRRKYGVRVALEPPRVDVATANAPSLGPAKAPITIVEFSDFQCPYCSRAAQTVERVVQRYGDRVRLVYRDFPLDIHPNAQIAARAAACARSQGKYWEMNRAMFADASKLAEPALIETAKGLGLDGDRFKSCLDAGDGTQSIQRDMADGTRYGVNATPTFFINGIMIVGARELRTFTDVIDDELERARQ